jgi:DNA-binding MarR family transcriptional regulator
MRRSSKPLTFFRTFAVPQDLKSVASFSPTRLHVLERGEAETGADLSRHFSTDPTAVTRAIDRMEEAGIVKREKHSADRRRFIIAITPKAHRLMPTAHSIARETKICFLAYLEKTKDRFLRHC